MPISSIAFSGLIDTGKDFVASQLPKHELLSFARPLYKLATSIFGGEAADYKTKDDLREVLQKIGQWGWGYHDPIDCPYTTERAAFCLLMRQQGLSLTEMPEYHWRKYGLHQGFWAEGLMRHLSWTYRKDSQFVITNVRFQHERDVVVKSGFEHFLVCCSEETRIERHGGEISQKANYNVSESYARMLAETLTDDRVIWNDHRPMPEGKKYMTVQEFVELATR